MRLLCPQSLMMQGLLSSKMHADVGEDVEFADTDINVDVT